MKREEIKVYSKADKVMNALEAKINELVEDYRKIRAMYIAEKPLHQPKKENG